MADLGTCIAMAIPDEEDQSPQLETSTLIQNENNDDTPPPYTEHDSVITPGNLGTFQDHTTFVEQEEKDNFKVQQYPMQEDQTLLKEEDTVMSSLEILERVNNSNIVSQKLIVTREIVSTLHEVSLAEAVDKILPIIIKIAKDPDSSIKEALVGELDKILYFYYEYTPPSLLNNNSKTDQPHIESNTFTSTLLELLLDQNETVASITQQAIITIATELMNTPPGSPRYELNRTLLDIEFYKGIVLGLIGIFNNNSLQKREGKEKADKENQEKDDILSAENAIVKEKFPVTSALLSPSLLKHNRPDISTFCTLSDHSISKEYNNKSIELAKSGCLMLISVLAPIFDPDGCTERILPIVQSMIDDPKFRVREEAATAIGNISAVVSTSVILEGILPLFLRLSVDTIWHVRRSCVCALPLICTGLPDNIKAAVVVEGIELFKNDVSRSVRSALVELTGEIVAKFLPKDWKETGNPGKMPKELVEFFLSLGNASSTIKQIQEIDLDRIYGCAYNFPAVLLTAGVEYWDSHFKDVYINLTKDHQLKVRRTFACSLHDIARIIGPERTERDLVQIFALYLMDSDEVKQGVLEHLSEFLSVLDASSRNEYIPILAEIWDGVVSNWHLRDTLACQLRLISRLFDAAKVVEHILPLAIRTCGDEFAAVRETGVEIFPVILDIVKKTVDEDGKNLFQGEETDLTAEELANHQQKYALALLNHVMEKIDELAKSSSYRTRLAFTRICRSLLEAGINPADFASFFLPRLVPLAEDPVVNVRIAVSRTIRTLCFIPGYQKDIEAIRFSSDSTNESPNEENLEDEVEIDPASVLDQILYSLSMDTDSDVYHYIKPYISSELLERYRKRRVEETEELEISKSKNDQQQDGTELIASKMLKQPLSSSPPISPTHLLTYNQQKDQVLDETNTSHFTNPSHGTTDKDDEEDVGSPMDIVDAEEEEKAIGSITTGKALNSMWHIKEEIDQIVLNRNSMELTAKSNNSFIHQQNDEEDCIMEIDDLDTLVYENQTKDISEK